MMRDPYQIRPSTLRHIQAQLARHQIVVASSLDSIGRYLYESSSYLTRQEQATICQISQQQIYRILYKYSESLPPKTLRVRRYVLPPHGEKTLTEWIHWSRNPKLTIYCVSMRLSYGWSLEEALTRAVRPRRTKKARRAGGASG